MTLANVRVAFPTATILVIGCTTEPNQALRFGACEPVGSVGVAKVQKINIETSSAGDELVVFCYFSN